MDTFHTFQLKQGRTFRIVLRNIYHSVNQDELQTEFSKLGHEAINVSNIKHSITKDPLSLFYIDLKQNATNEEVYNIKNLMNSIVKIEPPHIKREVVECKRCQRYGYTQKYCNRLYYCVNCCELHPTAQCNKLAENPAKCVHYEGNHPASYRVCPVYKELYNKRFPKPKIMERISHLRNTHNYTTSLISYAQTVRKSRNNETIHDSTLTDWKN